MIQIGAEAPDFEAENYSEEGGISKLKLSNFRGKVVILAFYPKDNTPGCTKEMCAFRDDLSKFEENEIKVIGVSRDSINSHEKFATKFGFGKLTLVSDYPDGKISQKYEVADTYPKRTLFIIDQAGQLRKIIEGMPKNEELISYIKEIKALSQSS